MTSDGGHHFLLIFPAAAHRSQISREILFLFVTKTIKLSSTWISAASSVYFTQVQIIANSMNSILAIWPFRPHKTNIFWKLMTPTIHWPTNHSPVTLPDPPDPPETHSVVPFIPPMGVYSMFNGQHEHIYMQILDMNHKAFWFMSSICKFKWCIFRHGWTLCPFEQCAKVNV